MNAEPEAKLKFRNALHDCDHAPADIVSEGSLATAPLVTIAIPTYRRPELLLEAVRSAVAQRFDRPFEVIVVDNDPASIGAEQLLQRVPDLRHQNFRYFVNRENIGMFGNWNRCIELARGEWLTVLNDDDLLDDDCLSKIFAVLDRDHGIDAITCGKRVIRENGEVVTDAGGPLPHRLAKRTLREVMFRGRSTRRIKLHKFFWGSLFGNSAGFVLRRRTAVEIGGFYPEEFPSADYFFYARLAKIAHFREFRSVAASIRVGNSETANPQTVRKSLDACWKLRQALLAGDVPRWWARFSPLVTARDWADYSHYWNVHVPKAELEAMLGARIPKHRPGLLWAWRFVLGGF